MAKKATANNAMANNHADRLGEEKISKLLWEFSLPATVGMLVNAIYNIVDRLFIGHADGLEQNGLAAITVAFPFMMIMMAFAIMLGVGGSTLFSIHLGRGKKKEADRFLGNALILMTVFSLIITVFGLLFLDNILAVFGASKAVLPFAREYLSVILYGTLFQTISMGLNNFIRANGSPNIAMISMLIGAGFNIVFDAILIYGAGMGLRGAALATIGGQALSMLWGLLYFARNKATHFTRLMFRPQLSKMWHIITTGIPAFVMNVVGSVLQAILNSQLVQYGGDIALSAMGLVNSLQTFLVMPVIGINQGVQPIISFNFGARKLKRTHKALKLAMLAATVITGIGWLLSLFCSKQLILIFTTDPELLEMGAKFCFNWFAALLVVGFQIIGSNYFQAIGKPAFATFLTMMRQIIVLIPLILILPRFFGLYGITWAAPISDIFTGIVVAVWLGFYLKHQEKQFVQTENRRTLAERHD